MAATRIDEQGFDACVSGHEIVVVGFVDDAASAGHFARLAEDARRQGIAFAEVTASSRGLFDMFGLTGTALAIFRQRFVCYLEPGLPEAAKLGQLLDRVATLDMSLVKREIEEERAARDALAVRRVCPTARRGDLP